MDSKLFENGGKRISNYLRIGANGFQTRMIRGSKPPSIPIQLIIVTIGQCMLIIQLKKIFALTFELTSFIINDGLTHMF